MQFEIKKKLMLTLSIVSGISNVRGKAGISLISGLGAQNPWQEAA